jgi:hypothetical protein
MTDWLTDDCELEKEWKDTAVAYFKAMPQVMSVNTVQRTFVTVAGFGAEIRTSDLMYTNQDLPVLANSILQSPSCEATSRSAGQEISRILSNSNVYYRIHKSSPLDLVLSQMNPVHTFISPLL